MSFPRLSEVDIASLSTPISEQDVKQSIFSIGGIKAPGPDGFPAIFFHKSWNTCKNGLINLAYDCFLKGSVPSDINRTLISPIPKVSNPTNLTHFRPISLCNTTYKVISKILMQRLRLLLPTLVSPNQVSFVPGRQIQDNIVVAQEVLHKFKNVKGKVGYIAWKIDLTKAYDRLQWGFIKQVLEEIGIEGRLNNLIMSCISNVQYKSIKLPAEICNKLDNMNRDFLWGTTSRNKKIHLVKWDMVCLPKNLGGLGIKKSKMMNQALLAKAGWRLSQRDTGLWGSFLKGKYHKGGFMDVYDSLKNRNCSSTWRGVSYGAKLLLDRVTWRVGDGRVIRFWTDNWVPELGKLQRHVSSPLSDVQINEKVSDYLVANEWDLQKLCSVLPWYIVHKIFSIHICGSISTEDSVI
ncbi:hypothetical protein LWI29_034688 [Acer saccharum]|uniref:Reverse transcriptase domain-containing protein n=1 Tax=Acer saccharum TaxID=4024 RepID=A0AA39VCQ1_ACESA|nr:hypothetical protein LWI29_034688 [Acer saccharum]